VEAGGRLVEDEEGLAGALLGELAGELDALGLAAGEGQGALAEGDVAEADVAEGLELLPDGGVVGEELAGVADGEVEGVGDALAAVGDGEGLAVVRGGRCRRGR
jgi:hypothetical protein